MSIENLNNPEDVKPDIESTEQPPVKYTEIEQKALELGWRPKEEYKGDPEKWRSAELFVALDEPIKRIEAQSRELKQLRSVIDDFKKHQHLSEQAAIKKAIENLKSEKKQALIDGDPDLVVELDDKIALAREQERITKELPPPTQTPVEHPELSSWKSRNNWYGSDRAMTALADKIGQEMYGRASLSDVLRAIDTEIKEVFKDKFENPNRTRQSTTEAPSNKGTKSSGVSIELSDDERRAMNKFVSLGIMTKEEYLADIKKQRGV